MNNSKVRVCEGCICLCSVCDRYNIVTKADVIRATEIERILGDIMFERDDNKYDEGFCDSAYSYFEQAREVLKA